MHTVESILVVRRSLVDASLTSAQSVISLLSADTPSTDSTAIVDAAKEVREDIVGYRKKVRRLARRSAEEAFD